MMDNLITVLITEFDNIINHIQGDLITFIHYCCSNNQNE